MATNSEIFTDEYLNSLFRLDSFLMSKLCPPATDTPRLLHHYTSIDGLHRVLTTSSIGASSLYYLNDPQEARYSRDVIAIPCAEDRFSDLFYDNSLAGVYGIWGLKYIPRDIFVTCFTEDGDSLPFWIAYADQAKGASLGFHVRDLQTLEGWQLVKVSYSQDEMVALTTSLLDMALHYRSHFTLDEQKRFIGDYVDYAMHLLIASLKRHEYSHEHEWRLVSGSFFCSQTFNTHYRSNGRWMIPFTKIDLAIGNGVPSEVVCGPLSQHELIAPVVHKLQKRSYIYEPFVTRASGVPYRG